MEIITNVLAWLKAHATEILALWAGIIGVAEIIVKWTESKKDDEIVGKIYTFGINLINFLTKLGLIKKEEK